MQAPDPSSVRYRIGYCRLEEEAEATVTKKQASAFSHRWKALEDVRNTEVLYNAENTKSCNMLAQTIRHRIKKRQHTLFVAAIAMLSSNGCQLICRIFLLKSIWSASVSFLIRCPCPTAPAAGLPALEPPFLLVLLPVGLVEEFIGVGIPTFFALKADLSA